MKQWVIKKSPYDPNRLEVWEYITDLDEAMSYWYVCQAIEKYGVDKMMPIAMNDLGGYHTLKPDNPSIVKIVLSEEKPKLDLKDAYPINDPDFKCGWISPDCTTYSCGYMEHIDCAMAIREYLYDKKGEVIADDHLLDCGWVKLLSGQRWLGYLHKMNDKQMKFIEDRGWTKY